MRYVKKRTYPVTHRKRNISASEKSVDISLVMAAGVLVFTFAKGMVWGFILKKWIDR